MPRNHRLPKSAYGLAPSDQSTHHKLTKERRAMLVEGIRVGLTKELAAQRARINVATFYAWLKTGRELRDAKWKPWPWVQPEGQKGDWEPGPLKKHSREVELLEAIEKSEADRITEALLAIRDAGRGGQQVATEETTTTAPDGTVSRTRKTRLTQPDWKAMSWVAERTRPKDYGARTHTELTGSEGGPVEIKTFVDLINVAAAQDEEEERARNKVKP